MRIKNDSFIRDYILNGKHTNKIFIYKDNKIVYQFGGWFETIRDEKSSYTKDVVGLDIEEPKKANKVDLTRNYNFYVSTKNIFNEIEYDLYLYAGNFEILEEKEYKQEIRNGETYVYKRITLKNLSGKFLSYGNFAYIEKEDEILTLQVFDRIDKTKEYVEQENFTRNINEKYNGRLYSFENLQKLYNEMKQFFERDKGGENE